MWLSWYGWSGGWVKVPVGGWWEVQRFRASDEWGGVQNGDLESGGQVNVRSGDRRNERGLGGSVSYSLSMSSTPQTMKPVIISKTGLLLSRSAYSRLIGPGAQVQTPPHIPTFSHPESLWGPVPTSGDGTDVWPSSGPPPLPPGPPPGKAVWQIPQCLRSTF